MGSCNGEVAPRLSIVVPAYRVEAYLGECLDSILAYPGPDVEVIAVNDGSPDGCAAILDGYAARDPRVVAVHLPANVGLGQARNAGVERATGEYVWFVDGDDWLPAGALRLVLERLAASRPDVLIVDHAEVFPTGYAQLSTSAELLRGLRPPITLNEQPMLLRLPQSACTKIVRRAFLDKTGLRFRRGWYEDSSFSHPLLIAADRIDALMQICYCYRRQTPGGITSTVSPKHFDVFEQYETMFAAAAEGDGAYGPFRAELFRLMINHYLVILGNRWRLPDELRREFFRRAVEHYTRWLPDGGYPTPRGIQGLKHRLLWHGAYRSYAALRFLNRFVGLSTLNIARRRRLVTAEALKPATVPTQRPRFELPAPRWHRGSIAAQKLIEDPWLLSADPARRE